MQQTPLDLLLGSVARARYRRMIRHYTPKLTPQENCRRKWKADPAGYRAAAVEELRRQLNSARGAARIRKLQRRIANWIE